MAFDQAKIDKIVSLVIQRLADTRQSKSDPPEKQSQPETNCLDSVVSLDSLRQIKNQKQIQVSTNAVITPAARDFLSENKISIVRIDAASNSNPTQPSDRSTFPKFGQTVIVSTSELSFERIRNSRCIVRKNDQQLVVEAQSHVERNGFVVVVSANPNKVACELNRNKNIFAAVVNDDTCINSLIKEIPLNVAVVSKTSANQSQITNIIDHIQANIEVTV
jgi:hypothetical protein